MPNLRPLGCFLLVYFGVVLVVVVVVLVLVVVRKSTSSTRLKSGLGTGV